MSVAPFRSAMLQKFIILYIYMFHQLSSTKFCAIWRLTRSHAIPHRHGQVSYLRQRQEWSLWKSGNFSKQINGKKKRNIINREFSLFGEKEKNKMEFCLSPKSGQRGILTRLGLGTAISQSEIPNIKFLLQAGTGTNFVFPF